MAEQAENQDLDELEELEEEKPETTDEAPEDESEEGQTKEQDTSDEEFEVVHEGETPTPETPKGFLKRIKKLTGRVEEARSETEEERKKREALEQQVEILQSALGQKLGLSQDESGQPNPDNYDGGIYDPKYVQDLNKYHEKVIQDQVKKHIEETTKSSYQTQEQKIREAEAEKALEAHYERAAKLNVKDYDQMEDKVIEIMGKDNFVHLAQNLDDTHVLTCYWAKNPSVCEKYAEMLQKQPIRALAEIGGLIKQIKVRPKKSTTSPDTDDEIEGGGAVKSKYKGPPGATFE